MEKYKSGQLVEIYGNGYITVGICIYDDGRTTRILFIGEYVVSSQGKVSSLIDATKNYTYYSRMNYIVTQSSFTEDEKRDSLLGYVRSCNSDTKSRAICRSTIQDQLLLTLYDKIIKLLNLPTS